jgi:hypothetical protein
VSIILPVFRLDRRVPVFGLLMVVLVGCSSPTMQEKMQDAQHDLVSEAMDVQRCERLCVREMCQSAQSL